MCGGTPWQGRMRLVRMYNYNYPAQTTSPIQSVSTSSSLRSSHRSHHRKHGLLLLRRDERAAAVQVHGSSAAHAGPHQRSQLRGGLSLGIAACGRNTLPLTSYREPIRISELIAKQQDFQVAQFPTFDPTFNPQFDANGLLTAQPQPQPHSQSPPNVSAPGQVPMASSLNGVEHIALNGTASSNVTNTNGEMNGDDQNRSSSEDKEALTPVMSRRKEQNRAAYAPSVPSPTILPLLQLTIPPLLPPASAPSASAKTATSKTSSRS